MILNRKLKIHDVENKLRPHPPHQPVMKNKKLDSGSLRPRSPVQVLKDYPIEKKKIACPYSNKISPPQD